MTYLLRFILALPFFALLTCTKEQAPAPVVHHGIDTTSHEWTFTMYEVGGMNTTLRDVAALSPDYAIALGHVEHDFSTGPQPWPSINAYRWDGEKLIPFSMPISPHDTVTIDPQKNLKPFGSWMDLDAIWAFRRDNIWYSSASGAIAHITILGPDTMVRQETWKTRPSLIPAPCSRIWAKDTSFLYFAGDEGNVVRNVKGVWEDIPADTKGMEITGLYGNDNGEVLIASNGSSLHDTFLRFSDGKWSVIWDETLPSLSDPVMFGAPWCFWGPDNSDSLWIAGLWLGKIHKSGSGRVTPILNRLPSGFASIHGNSNQDVFFVGWNGVITHYNGATYRDFPDFMNKDMHFKAVRMTGNDVFIVGYRYFGGGIFIHGHRYK